MNWNKLQQMQNELDNAILQAKPEMTEEERFNKTLVALSVEVAEVANCAEHFKFWKDNKGKVDWDRFKFYSDLMDINLGEKDELIDMKRSNQSGDAFNSVVTLEQARKLTLVEEASDCLHFILSLANQMHEKLLDVVERDCVLSKEEWYLEVTTDLRNMNNPRENAWRGLRDLNIDFYHYYTSLGITTQELEQAYYEKNEENYRRLREGY